MGHVTLRSLLIAPVLVLIALAEGAMSRAFGASCGDGVGPCGCGDVVVSNTTLGGSDPVLKTPCPCDGLLVAPNVTLEIGGTIRAEADNVCSGIRVPPGADGAVVRSGRIAGFDIGVSVEGVTGARIAKLLVSGSGTAGISADGDDNLVERNVVIGSSTGIQVAGARNEVRLNRTEESDIGIAVEGEDSVVSRNLVLGSVFDGIIISGEGATVDRNTCRANGGSGLSVEGMRHTVTLNITEFNQFDGFTVSASGSAFARNHSTDNGAFGILDFGAKNTYVKNLCIRNGLDSFPPDLCF